MHVSLRRALRRFLCLTETEIRLTALLTETVFCLTESDICLSDKGEYGPLNPILFSPQKKACARLFPTSSLHQPVRVAEALRIGPGAKARVVHVWPTCRWHLVRRASSKPAQRRAKSQILEFRAE